jgi:hypothetical protein
MNAGDYLQCFVLTHYGGRSNTGVTPALANSNVPITVGLASNNTIGNSNPPNSYNYLSGALLTYL